MKILLSKIAHARSGDKGDAANCGVIAFKEEWYPILSEVLTEEKVKEYFSFDNRIRFSIIDGPNKDFGNTPRMYGKEVCSEDWMIMTGDDNYYLPIVVEEILSVADSNTNFVYWDTLLNFANLEWKYRGVLYTKPEPEMIDVGSFATRPSLARQIKYDTTTHTGDGEFARDYVNMFCLEPNSYKKIDKILYLHN